MTLHPRQSRRDRIARPVWWFGRRVEALAWHLDSLGRWIAGVED